MHGTYGRAARGAGLLLALTLTAVVSQGVHDVAIEHLGVPYPTLVHPPAWVGVAGDVGRMLSLTVFALLARRFLDGRSLLAAGLMVGVFEVFLSERLRLAVITTFVAEAWRDGSWRYIVIDLLAPLVTSLSQGFAALLIARRAVPRSLPLAIASAVLAGAAIHLALTPIAAHLAAWLHAATAAAEPQQLHFPPYGGIVLVVIYITFLEPTTAAFVMAKLVWPALPGGRGARIALFTLLVLGCVGRLTSFLLTTFWVRQPPLAAIASTGQFAAETAVMAVLTGWLATSPWFRPSASLVRPRGSAAHPSGALERDGQPD